MSLFAAMVERVDRGVGKIVSHLKDTGEFDTTMIILLSDNSACYEWGPYGFDERSRQGVTILHTGDGLHEMGGPGSYHSYGSAWVNLGNTPFRLYKHFTHESGAASPFIVQWPNSPIKKGGWIREKGHITDVMPTLRAVAGADYPSNFAGRKVQPEEGLDLLPAFNGKRLTNRPIFFEHQAARGIIQGDWKAVCGKRMPWDIQWELYNLKNDRTETTDVAKRYPERVKQLIAQWEQYAKRTGIDWSD